MTGDTASAEMVMCGNQEHRQPARAYARLSWPDGRFKPGTACRICLRVLLNMYVLGDEQHSVHVELIGDPS